MSRFAYVNGCYVPHVAARVHIEDRGFQFADGVYEVVTIVNGRLIDQEGHMLRLERSLRALKMTPPMGRRPMELIMRELTQRNHVRHGLLYLQITRGVAPRDFKFPKPVRGTLVMTTRSVAAFATSSQREDGVAVITIPDIRWKRCDIKSVSLLPNVLGKQQAVEAGAFEAWQVDDDGLVTEGCSSNAWIVTRDGVLVTRRADHDILNGVTRLSILRLAEAAGIRFEERSFSVAEAYEAREAFLSSATTFVTAVTRIDGLTIGDGRPGDLGRRLRQAYLETVGQWHEQ
ncbi:D-alanine aminotransferase [Azospirillaceae bacterium]